MLTTIPCFHQQFRQQLLQPQTFGHIRLQTRSKDGKVFSPGIGVHPHAEIFHLIFKI